MNLGWLLQAMVALAPPGLVPTRETAEAGHARYATIVADMESVLTEAHGTDGEAAMLLAIAYHESGLRADVDAGTTRGGGLDVCLLQIRASKLEADELARDRRACLRKGLRLARGSIRACAKNPREEQLAAYASGSCTRGAKESRAFYALTRRVLGYKPARPKGGT